MNSLPGIDMIEATRLTREGRLEEAMAILRGALSTPSSAAPSKLDRDARQKPAEGLPPMIDMVAPPTRTEGSWTSPQFRQTSSAGRPANIFPSQLPELRGLFNRMGQPRAASGLDGLAGSQPEHAPAPLPDGAEFQGRTYANEAGSRAYKLYVPSGYVGQALPLVVMLHGCTQSPDDFAAGTRMNDLAEEQTFLVAYPAQTRSANASKCWNWFNVSDQLRDQGEPSLIAGITRQIMRDFSINPRRVFTAGLSAGGAAAAIMGSTYPDLYAAVGVHSGLACGAASDMSSALIAMRNGGSAGVARSARHNSSVGSVPTIVFHGDRDAMVNTINGDQVIAQARPVADLRTTVSHGEAPGGISYTCTVQRDERGRPMLEQWVLHGAGHAWSGGSPAGSYTEPRGPDASREMIRFFLQDPEFPG
jgi:poly(hydroxyalkanoate) depolymerase family esterase